MNPRRRGSLAASPLLIGALTTLIVVVAVYLSYNANNGLPFVPTYDINVELPEASALQKANEVRIAGNRVGVVSALKPVQNPKTGRLTALAELKLEKHVEPLPADTRAIVLSVSTIGLKYLELEKGKSSKTLKPGSTIPLSQTREPVDINELFNMFDAKTRTAIQQNNIAFGDGLAGRGLGINEIIHTLVPLTTKATPVLHNLASPKTRFENFFPSLDSVAAQVAPVANTQAAFFTDASTFFTAWARVAPELEATIKGGPEALKQATYSFAYQAPFIENATEFMRLLHPSASSLRTVAPQLAHALTVGAVNLKAAVSLNKGLAESAKSLQEYAKNPIVTLGLEALTQTTELGTPLLAGIAPEQAYCNYITLAFRNVAGLQAENVGVGSLARAAVVLSPTGPNAEGFPSSGPAVGPSVEKNAYGQPVNNNYLHYNPYPNVAGPGQPRLCEAGNENYIAGKPVIGNLPAGSSTNNREITTREQNLFGQRYPASTLRALGITSSGSGS
jgi:virulence factor Mce-like protein